MVSELSYVEEVMSDSGHDLTDLSIVIVAI